MTSERKCEHGYGIKQGPCPICDAPLCTEVLKGWCIASMGGDCVGTTNGRCHR